MTRPLHPPQQADYRRPDAAVTVATVPGIGYPRQRLVALVIILVLVLSLARWAMGAMATDCVIVESVTVTAEGATDGR